MKWFMVNLALALAVTGYVTVRMQQLDHTAACIYSALTIVDASQHHVAGPLLDGMRQRFDEEC